MLKLIILLNVIFILSFISYAQNDEMSFSVLDESNRFYSGLKSSDIQISSGGNILKIETLEENNDTPIEIIIMIDASISQEKSLSLGKKVAQVLIDKVLNNKTDKVAIVKFAENLTLEQDLTNDFNLAKYKANQIEIVTPPGYRGRGVIVGSSRPFPNKKGSTSIWGGVKQTILAFGKLNRNKSRKMILLISDGVNTTGKEKLKHAVIESQKLRIPIYAVGIGHRDFGGVDKKNLKKLTLETGGIYKILKKEKDVHLLIEFFKNNLSRFYKVKLAKSPLMKEKVLDKIEIKVINPSLKNKKLFFTKAKSIFLEK